jgi:hypothetical protein
MTVKSLGFGYQFSYKILAYFAIAIAVLRLSPVIILTFTPALLHFCTA